MLSVARPRSLSMLSIRFRLIGRVYGVVPSTGFKRLKASQSRQPISTFFLRAILFWPRLAGDTGHLSIARSVGLIDDYDWRLVGTPSRFFFNSVNSIRQYIHFMLDVS